MSGATQLQTRGGGSERAIDASSLSRLSLAELDGVFEELEVAALSELQGPKEGRLLAVSGLDWLPSSARVSLMRALNRVPLWRGERLEGEYGANRWVLPGGGLEFARYLAKVQPSGEGCGEVIRLDYDVAANPGPLRRVVGELRRLGPGLFLGRLRVRARGREIPLSYFTLEG